MMHEPRTFPTFRTWQRMSEREQDALLDRIESRRRWGLLGSRVLVALACAAAIAAGSALMFVR
jgi:hypothetical protein